MFLLLLTTLACADEAPPDPEREWIADGDWSVTESDVEQHVIDALLAANRVRFTQVQAEGDKRLATGGQAEWLPDDLSNLQPLGHLLVVSDVTWAPTQLDTREATNSLFAGGLQQSDQWSTETVVWADSARQVPQSVVITGHRLHVGRGMFEYQDSYLLGYESGHVTSVYHASSLVMEDGPMEPYETVTQLSYTSLGQVGGWTTLDANSRRQRVVTLLEPRIGRR